MKDRIQLLIDNKGITAGDLAERLDVQRSNISHILNGRNKPGAVFIEKLLLSFPDVNARWLLTGEGSMFSGFQGTIPENKPKQPEKPVKQQQMFPLTDSVSRSRPDETDDKTIEKIILLFSDGTFTYYNND